MVIIRKINWFQEIDETLIVHRTLQLFGTFIAIYCFRNLSPHTPFNYIFFIALLLQLALYKQPLYKPQLWYTILIFLIVRLLKDYYLAANHLFVSIYITLSIIIYLHNGKQANVLYKNCQLILGLVLFLSGFQKLISPEYTSGHFFEYMVYKGDFLWPLRFLSAEFKTITAANSEIISQTRLIYEKGTTFQALTAPFENLQPFSKIMAQVSIWLELLSGIAMLVNGKKWYAHLLAAITILGVAVTREEFGFLSLLTLAAMPLCRWRSLHIFYVILIVLFHAGIVIRLGFN